MAHEINFSEKAGVRYLHFGSTWVQGAMRLARPDALELAYTREMMACLLLRDELTWPRHCLQIGLGAASLSRFIARYLPETISKVVEINPAVVAMASQYFKLPPQSAHFHIDIADGADYIVNPQYNAEKFDVIFVDGFGADARPGRLDLPDFYTACRERLSSNGVLVCNLLGRSKGFLASAERLHQAFAGRSLVFPSCDSGNAIAFAAVGDNIDIALSELREKAEALKQLTGLDLLPTITRLQNSATCQGGVLHL